MKLFVYTCSTRANDCFLFLHALDLWYVNTDFYRLLVVIRVMKLKILKYIETSILANHLHAKHAHVPEMIIIEEKCTVLRTNFVGDGDT